MCLIQKTRIEIRTNFISFVNICKVTQIEVKVRCDDLSNMINNNGKAKIDFLNVG